MPKAPKKPYRFTFEGSTSVKASSIEEARNKAIRRLMGKSLMINAIYDEDGARV